jgi:4-amino-4-deoxy-L-arabinose transferase-like glycosyltransferase
MTSWHRPERLGVAALVSASFLLNLRHLGHRALTLYDEAFHALTARNLLRHPLKPTLFDQPYLPYDFRNWLENHVWLHKPILPLWEIALSYTMFGVNTFALRLPAALLSTGAVLLTYLIGRELFDRRAAFVAAAIQALNPAILSLVHGYSFSDTFDVNLLFYVELGIYFIARAMRTGSSRDIGIAGVAHGLAFLSKS